jgi:hypothetical protein
MASATKDPAWYCGTANESPKPLKIDLVWSHRAHPWRCDSVDVLPRDPPTPIVAIMNDYYHRSFVHQDILRSFGVAADFEDGRTAGDFPNAADTDDGDDYSLMAPPQSIWSSVASKDNFFEDVHDNYCVDMAAGLFLPIKTYSPGASAYWAPESGWFDHDGSDPAVDDDIDTFDRPDLFDVPMARILPRPRNRQIRVQHMAKITALRPALANSRQYATRACAEQYYSTLACHHHPCGEDSLEQDPDADEERIANAMVTLAEVAATAANLLLLASAFEAMRTLCIGLQGSDVRQASALQESGVLHGGSSTNLGPDEICQDRHPPRELSPGGVPVPCRRLSLALAMAA